MKCFVCDKKIWFWQRRTRTMNPALRKILAIGDLIDEDDAGWMHTDCQLSIIYTVLEDTRLSLEAIKGYLGFIKKQEKKKG